MKIIYYITNFILLLWQLPQMILGAILLLWYKVFGRVNAIRNMTVEVTEIQDTVLVSDGFLEFKQDFEFTLVVLNYDNQRYSWGFSLGSFIFCTQKFYDNVQAKTLLAHEAGHSIQSLYLGWLYLLVIGLPSLLITGISSDMAKDCYFEQWANVIANDIKIVNY